MDKSIKNHKFRGTDTFREMISNFNNVIVYFDPDVDGMIAGYFVCKYLTMLGKKFQWYVNSDRKHDWSIDLSKIKGRDIIAVDFMIPEEKVKDIVSNGCNIVSMDHHVNQDTFIDIHINKGKGVVINNQYPFEEEDSGYLSGAGVVFETICNIESKFNTKENRALVGLTLLSDVCNIENSLARGYLYDLYNHKYNGYIKYLIDNTLGNKDFSFGVPRLDRKYVDYVFSPAINSLLRFNKGDDVVKFFLGSGKLDLSYHRRQKALVKSMLDVAKVREFPNLRIVYVRDWEIPIEKDISVISNFIGLLASRFLDGKKSVIAYCISKNEDGKKYMKRASFRGNINGVDYLSVLNDKVEGVGHSSAFGILSMVLTYDNFLNISDSCKMIEGECNITRNIKNLQNLSIFSNRHGKDFAEYNMYCLTQNSKYLRYTGNNIKVIREGANYRVYKVDGVEVVSFDLSLDFFNGVIYPILERGYVYYYLQSEN